MQPNATHATRGVRVKFNASDALVYARAWVLANYAFRATRALRLAGNQALASLLYRYTAKRYAPIDYRVVIFSPWIMLMTIANDRQSVMPPSRLVVTICRLFSDILTSAIRPSYPVGSTFGMGAALNVSLYSHSS